MSEEEKKEKKPLGEKVKAVGGKFKEIINKLPFNGMAQKVPALAKVADFANYAACILIVLIVAIVVVVAVPKGGKKLESQIDSETAIESSGDVKESSSKKKGNSNTKEASDGITKNASISDDEIIKFKETTPADETMLFYTFTKDMSGVRITGIHFGNFKGKVLVFPDTIEGMPVKEVWGNKYWPTKLSVPEQIVAVIVPEGVDSFSGIQVEYDKDYKPITNIKYISLPSTLGWFTKEAFKDLDKLVRVDIPENAPIEVIPYECFHGCSKLASFSIPNSVKTIGEEAFMNSGVASVSISNSVKEINASAFRNSGLSSVTIPDNTTFIGNSSFRECQNLKTVTFSNKELAEGEVFESTTNIDNYAFYNCYNLSTVALPATLKRIGARAFCACFNLTDMTIPENLKSVKFYNEEDFSGTHLHLNIQSRLKSLGYTYDF